MNRITAKKKINLQMVLLVILAILAWVIIAGNTATADCVAYRKAYESLYNNIPSAVVDRLEYGFILIWRICQVFNLSYNGFLAIYGAIGVYLVSNSCIKYTSRPATAFFLYLTFPFLLNVAQIRNFMSFALVFFSLRYLVKFNLANLLRFLMCIALAASQHVSSYAFLLLIFVYIKQTNRVLIFSALSLLLMFFIRSYLVKVMSLVSRVIPQLVYYIPAANENTGGRYQIIAGVIIAACCNYALYIKKGNALTGIAYRRGEDEMLTKVCSVGLVFVGFRLLEPNLLRLYQTVLPAGYALITDCDWTKNVNMRVERMLLLIVIVAYCGAHCYMYFGAGPSSVFSTVTVPAFCENLLILWLNR